jgi:acetolactate synthase I/II/III large subunit
MKASDLLVKCLENEGVKYVFGLPGEETQDLLFSLEKSSIKFIPTRHEQGAAFMADVYGRLTGKAGVCLSTLGPGATNLVTGIADAFLDRSPVVAITAQGDSDRLHKESHQYIDVVNMLRPIVKWNTSITNPAIIPEAVRKAFKVAEVEKPGPTHLELPEDIARMDVQKEPLYVRRLRRASPDYKALAAAFDIIKQAKRPLIIAGNGAIRKLASKHLRLFVEKTNIPVVSTFMGKGAVSGLDPRSLFSIGLKAEDFVMRYVKEADVVITVGYDIVEFDPKNWNPDKEKRIVHIDFAPAEVYEYYQPEAEVVADISATLWELNKHLEEEHLTFDIPGVFELRSEIQQDIKSYSVMESVKEGYGRHAQNRFTVPGILNVLREAMGAQDILLSDVGSHKVWIARNYPAYEPNTVLISNGLAAMGFALPGAVAAKFAVPERNVVCAMGDGGFLMNVQEIETATRLGLSFTILVFNDNDYGLIRWKQEASTGKSFGTGLTNPDFLKLADAFGIKGYAPKTEADLREAIQNSIHGKGVSLIAVDIDPAVNLKLSRKLDTRAGAAKSNETKSTDAGNEEAKKTKMKNDEARR